MIAGPPHELTPSNAASRSAVAYSIGKSEFLRVSSRGRLMFVGVGYVGLRYLTYILGRY